MGLTARMAVYARLNFKIMRLLSLPRPRLDLKDRIIGRTEFEVRRRQLPIPLEVLLISRFSYDPTLHISLVFGHSLG